MRHSGTGVTLFFVRALSSREPSTPRPMTRSIFPRQRPSYLAASAASALVFALYLVTLAPSAALWDAGEYVAAACGLGIPHPPGNPLFVLIGRVTCLLPIAPNQAMRLNVLTAAATAISAGLWFLVAERVTTRWLAERWQQLVAGALAALIGATAFTVWNQSVVSEKVYTLALLGIAVVSWLTVRWLDDPDAPGADRKLVLAAYLLGLGYANHMIGMIAAPALVLAVVVKRPAMLRRWRLTLAGAAAMLLGMTPFATQPIRAAHFPPINEGEVTACTTELRLDCTLTATTWERFKYHFQRKQYGKPPLAERQAPFTAQVGMWWLYFKWQWLRDVHGETPAFQLALAACFFGLGLWGARAHRRRDPETFWFFGPLVLSTTVVLIYYLNFRYGWSQAPELSNAVEREVRDRDYFYIWSFSLWGLWAALGLVAAWETVTNAVTARAATKLPPPRRAWLLTAPILGLALLPLIGNWRAASRAGETSTLDFAHDLLNSVEPYGVLFTVGDNDSFPLWYAQEVEGIRKDVTVALTPYIDTDWYARQLIRRPVHRYDAAKGPAIYRGRDWPLPLRPILDMTLEEADAIPEVMTLPTAQRFVHGDISLTIPAGYLFRGDVVMLRTIKDSFPDRPIYFTRGATRRLDLRPYLLEQGLASKLVGAPQVPSRDTLPTNDGFMDVKRSAELWKSVYRAPEAIAGRGDWVDRASLSIPIIYIDSGLKVARALALRGDTAAAARVAARVESVIQATRLDSLFAPATVLPSPVAPADSPRATLTPTH
jgi:transmembrane protein TMEM260 (protein O-mannosyltransferase)